MPDLVQNGTSVVRKKTKTNKRKESDRSKSQHIRAACHAFDSVKGKPARHTNGIANQVEVTYPDAAADTSGVLLLTAAWAVAISTLTLR